MMVPECVMSDRGRLARIMPSCRSASYVKYTIATLLAILYLTHATAGLILAA